MSFWKIGSIEGFGGGEREGCQKEDLGESLKIVGAIWGEATQGVSGLEGLEVGDWGNEHSKT